MPVLYAEIETYRINLKALIDHYLAKGCSERKAEECAYRKRARIVKKGRYCGKIVVQ